MTFAIESVSLGCADGHEPPAGILDTPFALLWDEKGKGSKCDRVKQLQCTLLVVVDSVWWSS